ncbi:MAG: ATP-binding cassette domain-containing protein [Treponema sp.]|nr:ATP-binding cassette domain-containing protein [Candidatus Treponema equifaecale]
MKKLLPKIISILVFLTLWQIGAVLVNSPLVFPSVKQTVFCLLQQGKSTFFYINILSTLARVFVCFGLSLVFGTFLGFCCGISSKLKGFLEFPLAILKSTPVVALILIFMFAFKSNLVPVLVGILLTLPVMVEAVSSGFEKDENQERLLQMARIFEFTKSQSLRFIQIPHLFPFFSAGINATFGMTWKVIVAGEVLAVPKNALGTRLVYAQAHLESQEVMAIALVIVVLSFGLEQALKLALKQVKKDLSTAVEMTDSSIKMTNIGHNDSAIPTEHKDSVIPTEHKDSASPTEHKDFVISTEHKDFVISTEHKDTATPTEHKDSVIPAEHKDFVISNEHKDSAIPTEHKDSVISTGAAAEWRNPTPITIKNLNIRFGEKQIFHNFNFSAAAGQILGIIAPSGFGKTTLLNEISKQYKVSFMFQEPRLLEQLTVRQNILLPLLNQMPLSEALNQIREILDVFELQEKSGSLSKNLSGGQRQRTALARAVLFQKNILLLDEPFSSIDYELKIKLIEYLKKRFKKENRTVIFVTHDIRDAEALCDSVIRL